MKSERLSLLLLPLSLSTLLFSCGEEPKPKKKQLTMQQMKELSKQMNVWDATRENDEIEQYIKAHQYEMQRTNSGLRWMLLKKGDGPQAQAGLTATVSYKIYLLDGTVCYTSEKDKPKDVLIGKDNVEAGLHEGLQLMHVGDKMRFILPSHLAHGLSGDQSKIPPLTSVVYEIELLNLSIEDKVVK
jgi:FKBP-type peptidyl-prolyl cis-trans isomerase FkpA